MDPEMLLDAWRTNNRVTVFLFENLPRELWSVPVPEAPRRTVRMIAGHIHNARCMWIKTLGKEHGIAVPKAVDRLKVGPKELIPALGRSSRGMLSLLKLGLDHGGTLPMSKSYVWRNLPLDVAHVLTYFVAHEGHHRGQIVMLARQSGFRLPAEIAGGLWHFTKRSKETVSHKKAQKAQD
ncbi:MAG TPA: DinB family protein [Pyrinomonadaceae bacterium]|nr:DinB family protein [Pyrinomonadaceae bacterium]